MEIEIEISLKISLRNINQLIRQKHVSSGFNLPGELLVPYESLEQIILEFQPSASRSAKSSTSSTAPWALGAELRLRRVWKRA